MNFFDDECSLDLPRGPEPYGRRYVGRAEVRRGLMTRFETTPDVQYGEIEHFAAGWVGEADEAPRWNPGDFFGERFAAPGARAD